MALPNSNFDPALVTDSTAVNLIDDKIMAVLQLVADILGVDISSQRTVTAALATFDATNGRWRELIAQGAAASNGFVVKDNTNTEQWRIRCDGSSANKLIFERWGGASYTTYLTITDTEVSYGGNELGAITSITPGTGLDIDDAADPATSGDITINVKDGGIDTTQIADSAITNAKIASDADIAGSKIADSSITAAKMDGTGTADKPLVSDGTDAAFTAVGTAGIQDSAITTAKIADQAVTAAKIEDLTILVGNLAATGGDSGQVLTVVSGAVEWEDPPNTEFSGEVCSLYMTATSQIIDENTETDIEWDAEYLDSDGFHSTVTNPERITFDAGNAGKYMFIFQARLDYPSPAPSSSDTMTIKLIQYDSSATSNVTVFSRTAMPLYTNATVRGECMVDVDAGDYVKLSVTHSVNAEEALYDGRANTFLQCFKFGT